MVQVTVKRSFKADFDLAVSHYGLSAYEIEEAKAAARADMENAEVCFASIAAEIKADRGYDTDRRLRGARE